ncbi:hypothetical protein HDU88_001594 [Geranomyces variabilis]|nr:hypothetical protein HDU88_001594 [Geranomyces variabilis]
MQWPADSNGASLGPANNPVLAAGLSLVHQFLQNDRVIRNYRLQCLTITPTHPPPYLDYEDITDLTSTPGGPALLTPAQIRAQVAANWPILGVSDAHEMEGWDGLTLLNPNGPDTVLIAGHIFRAMCAPKNATEAVLLACQFAFIVMHELAHVLQFKVGYCGTLQSDGSAFRTPTGVLYGDAGFSWERQTLGAIPRIMHSETLLGADRPEALALVCDVPGGQLHQVPLTHLISLLTASFWAGSPRIDQIRLPTGGPVVPGREGRIGGRQYIVKLPEAGKTPSPAPPSPTNPQPIATDSVLPEYRYHMGAFGAVFSASTPS